MPDVWAGCRCCISSSEKSRSSLYCKDPRGRPKEFAAGSEDEGVYRLPSEAPAPRGMGFVACLVIHAVLKELAYCVFEEECT